MSFQRVFHLRNQRYYRKQLQNQKFPSFCNVPISLTYLEELRRTNLLIICKRIIDQLLEIYCDNEIFTPLTEISQQDSVIVQEELNTLDDIILYASSVFESINTNEMLTICFSRSNMFVKCVLIEIKNNSIIRSSYHLCDNYKSKNIVNRYMTNILENYLYTQRCIELLNKVCRDVEIVYDANHTIIHVNIYHFFIDKYSFYKIRESISGQSYNTFEEFANFVYSNLVQQSDDGISLRFVE